MTPFDAPLLPVVGRSTEVPLVQGSVRRYVNLDYAASAPALQSVADTVADLLPVYSSVHRGAGYLSQVSTVVYESARHDVAGFVNARESDVVVFTRNTTDALNLLASAVPGDVLHLDIEHHANLLPWQRNRGLVVVAGQTLGATLRRLEAALASRPFALLAVSGASNVTGECLPLQALTSLAHRYGARIAVDGAQLIAHRRIDIAALEIDYLAFSGHKLYAPFGAGALVGRRDWLDAAPAYLAGGGAVREVGLTETEWADSPARHEAGTPNVIGVAAMAAACQAIAGLPGGLQERHERLLQEQLLAGLAALGIAPLQLWSDAVKAADTVGIAAFQVPGYSAGLVAAYLSAEHGIGVRDGRFCAHPLLTHLGSEAAVRVSIGLGSSQADIRQLLQALASLLQAGPTWSYANPEGRWVPQPDPRQLPAWLGAARLDGAPIEGASPCESLTVT